MATMPDRPDLGQLRRQAKELHRAASGGDPVALRQLAGISGPPTLSGAQAAVARRHGYGSWAKLRSAVEAARVASNGPLMADKARHAAVYGAADQMSFATRRGWRPEAVPAGAVFTSQAFVTSHLAAEEGRYRLSTTIVPTNGRVYLTTSGRPVAVACLGTGAPPMVTLLEHLVALGVASFVAIGPAPAIDDNLAWGDCVVIDRALRDDGVSSHYLPAARYASADAELTQQLVAQVRDHGVDPRVGSAWTVPTPFRTTQAELSAYRAEGVLVTDMVTAALFAVAAALGAHAASAVIATTPVSERRSERERERSVRPAGGMKRLLDAAVEMLSTRTVDK